MNRFHVLKFRFGFGSQASRLHVSERHRLNQNARTPKLIPSARKEMFLPRLLQALLLSIGGLLMLAPLLLNAQQPAPGFQRIQRIQQIQRLAPIEIESPPPATALTDEDFAKHVVQLKQRLPHDDFHIVIQKPFVVVGDAGKANVERAATGTVEWAVKRIKATYFKHDPDHIIDIWLFKDAESYNKHNELLFEKKPTTPYGYYSPADKALVMNISTGGGTLVHEIVHPFMARNFPACPAWFNEGLASLYEQSRDANGQIMGSTNWRLRGLQLAIEDNRLPSFKELCSTTTREFYDGHGTNYAQARYLCYYLQEKKLLTKYYHAFVKSARLDPTGYETLQQILDRDDMDQFQAEWQKYVSKLRFP